MSKVIRGTRKINKPANRVATVKTVKRMIAKNIETHVYDTGNDGFTPGTTVTVHALNNISQGDGAGNRTGIVISPVKLKINMGFIRSSLNTLGERVRVLVVRDKSCHGVVPTETELFNTGDGLKDGYAHCPPFLDGSERFTVLYDKFVNLDSSQGLRGIKISKKLRGKIYFGSAGDDYEKNSLFLVCVAYDNTNKTEIEYSSRLYFKDG